MILAIDPGPEQSAYVYGYPQDKVRPVEDYGMVLNRELEVSIRNGYFNGADDVLIEDWAPWGKPAGQKMVDVCKAIGRFQLLCEKLVQCKTTTYFRRDVCRWLVGLPNAKKSQIRAYMIQRYGPSREQAIGRKGCEGPLYGLRVHQMDALAMAVMHVEQQSAPRSDKTLHPDSGG